MCNEIIVVENQFVASLLIPFLKNNNTAQIRCVVCVNLCIVHMKQHQIKIIWAVCQSYLNTNKNEIQHPTYTRECSSEL